jgi:rhodanese-related sulfurtransferase
MFNFNSFFQPDNTDYQAILNDIESGNAQLVDIREQNEWDRGHFDGAINVPLSGLSRGVGVDTLKNIKESNKKIFLHCHSGSRVQMAKRMLAAFGCTEFDILPASMTALRQNGFKLTY